MKIQNWNEIDWKRTEKTVKSGQEEIKKWQKKIENDKTLIKWMWRAQKAFSRRLSTKLWAIKEVTSNRGKATAGVDGEKSLKPQEKLEMAKTIKLGNTRADNIKRVWIPKPGTDEKRPLGIPTMKERVRQKIALMTLEPEWEEKMEERSYGFRPGRSCHDAIKEIIKICEEKEQWVLDADIRKYFDNINHEKILEKLSTYPAMRKQIRKWLKAGIEEAGKIEKPTKGTPQGGVISPLLANIMLDGMEKEIKNQTDTEIKLVRYADDFIVMHPLKKTIEKVKEEVEKYLGKIGLELNPKKTRIVHTSRKTEEKAGIRFLGFEIKTTERKGTIRVSCRVRKEKIGEHMMEIKKKMKKGKPEEIEAIIRGWKRYYLTWDSIKIFEEMEKWWRKVKKLPENNKSKGYGVEEEDKEWYLKPQV